MKRLLLCLFTLILWGCFCPQIFPQAKKRILIETAAGMDCQFCPLGYATARDLYLNQDDFIFVSVHHNDALTIPGYQTASNFFSLPSAHLDRTIFDVHPGSWGSFLQARKNNPAPADLEVITSYNSTSKMLIITIKETSFELLGGDIRLGAIVMEDGVTGPSPDFDQANAYSGRNDISLRGWESQTNPVPASRAVYHHVARDLPGGYTGTFNSLPTFIPIGNSHSYTYFYTVPPEYNIDNLYVVGFLIDASTGIILNAARGNYIPGYRNGKPQFISTPDTHALASVPYNYQIFAADPDDDTLIISSVSNLPAWLTVQDDSNGQASLFGIPPFPGNYSVSLKVSDGDWDIEQKFTIQVGAKPAEDWFFTGIPGFSPVPAEKTELAFDPTGKLYCMYVNDLQNQLALMEHKNGGWQQQSLPVSSNPDVNALAVGGDTLPYILAKNKQMRVLRLREGNWEQIGDTLPATDIAHLDMAMKGSTPYVAYMDIRDNNRGIVKWWTGTQWESLGGGSFSNMISVWNQLAVNDAGEIFVLSGDGSGTDFLSVVRKFDGNNWVKIGNAVDSTLFTQFEHKIGFGKNGMIYVALVPQFTETLQVYEYDGISWNLIGDDLAGGKVSDIDLKVNSQGQPIVSFRDENMGFRTSVMRYEATGWEYVGLRGFTNPGTSQALALDRKDIPYVSYVDKGSNSRVSVKQFAKSVGIFTTELADYHLSVYPNPSEGFFRIESRWANAFQLIDLSGKIVLAGKIHASLQLIEVNDIPAGIYLLRVSGNKGVQTTKLMLK